MNIFFENSKENFYAESFEDAVDFVFRSGDKPLNIDYVITSDKEKAGRFFLDEKFFLYWLVGNYIWRRRNNVKETESLTVALETLSIIWEDINLMPNLIPEGDFLRYEPDSFKIEHLTIKGRKVLFYLSQSGFSEAERDVVKRLLSAFIHTTF